MSFSSNFFLRVISVVIFCSSVNLSQPEWLDKRPVNKEYYTGIAGVTISNSGTDYKSIAKAKALADLASEISVNINSAFLTKTIEKAQLVQSESEVNSTVQSAAEIEEYEFVDDYTDDDIYWVYLRVSKVSYNLIKQKKIDIAKGQAENSYKKGKQLLKVDDISGVLQSLVSALLSMQKVFIEPIETEINGSKEILQELIITEIQKILSNVSFDKPSLTFSGRYNEQSNEILPIKVFYTGQGKKIPISFLPLAAVLNRGSFMIPGDLKTDALGKLDLQINPILSQEKKQNAALLINLFAYSTKDTVNPILIGILRSFKSPSCELNLNLNSYKVSIISSESNVGVVLNQKIIEPIIQSKLTSLGFSIVSMDMMPDFEINIDGSATQFSTAYSQFVCMAAGTLSFRNIKSEEVIFSKSYQNVKGVQLDYEKAGFKAMSALGSMFSSELNDSLLNKLFRISK